MPEHATPSEVEWVIHDYAELAARYRPGQWIAVREYEVVDDDADLAVLSGRVNARWEPQSVLIARLVPGQFG